MSGAPAGPGAGAGVAAKRVREVGAGTVGKGKP